MALTSPVRANALSMPMVVAFDELDDDVATLAIAVANRAVAAVSSAGIQ
jgi:hypothetical protein